MRGIFPVEKALSIQTGYNSLASLIRTLHITAHLLLDLLINGSGKTRPVPEDGMNTTLSHSMPTFRD